MKPTKIILSLFLVFAILTLSACTTQEKNLMENIQPNHVEASAAPRSQDEAVTDFAVRLFRASEESGENTLISPLSVLCALAMTANGAAETTLEEMETVLGMSKEALNFYLHSYMSNLPHEEAYKLSLANSVWFKEDERFAVDEDFLQTNADYYGADIYQAPFNEETCDDINNWVKEKTDGMIPKILEQLTPDAVMCLINALAFEAEWDEIYEEHEVREGIFTAEDGTEQEVDFMHSTEYSYLEDENATGFLKYYKGSKYAFVALLPKEGVSVSEYLETLDGKTLHDLLSKPQNAQVFASIPKFASEYSVQMNDILKEMGMPTAFDAYNADFSGLGSFVDGNVYISQVLHKTYISVAEKGTKAGAVTSVIMDAGGALLNEFKTVDLNRPFVYMLIDCESNTPFFIGTMMDMGN